MFALQKSTKRASTRQQIDIEGVRDGVLMLPHRKYRVALSVSSVNFELKSEDEQDAIIDTYESFLNSVGCPLQILIRTREIDMDKYLHETEEIYKTQLQNYDEFIRSLITTNKILTRNFYVIVPYDASSKIDFDSIREQLALRVDIVQKGLARLGMQSHELSSLEVLDLFYSFYNPEQAKLQPLTQQALELLHAAYTQKEATV
jgi:hypothetical protein